MSRLTIRPPQNEDDRAWLTGLWVEEWGGTVMVTRGRVHGLAELEARIAWAGGSRVGAAAYRIEGPECELLSLNASAPGQGVGTALLDAVEEAARAAGCSRVWLITSNDNLDALRFYQRRGYRLVAVHVGAIDEARRIKPSIPLVGDYGIPIHDELELEKRIWSRPLPPCAEQRRKVPRAPADPPLSPLAHQAVLPAGPEPSRRVPREPRSRGAPPPVNANRHPERAWGCAVTRRNVQPPFHRISARKADEARAPSAQVSPPALTLTLFWRERTIYELHRVQSPCRTGCARHFAVRKGGSKQMLATNAAPFSSEIRRRRTFAIISHPDAGKTTLTEKLLLYGGAIHLAGSVKARRAARHVTSDWMEIEKQRGISVTSSVLQFEYDGCMVNILDTPGHQDFSEDTYRTLEAADSAVMLIDAAKGVEPQTIKLFHVCKMRGIPVFTFVNKLDREGKDPFALMQEIEDVLGMRTCPMNWPVGMGSTFKGVFDRQKGHVELFDDRDHGQTKARTETIAMDDPKLPTILGEELYRKLREDIELLDVAGDPWDFDRFRRGDLSPLFWGSALTNFGVQPFLEYFLELAPSPAPRLAGDRLVEPEEPRFSAFVFKIQANMNPAHRDRIAFLRIVSGRFQRGMEVQHVRLGKKVRLSQPQQFMAQERQIVEEAYAGDIIGVFDPGIFRIGDTLCTGEPVQFEGIPSFSPEHFARVRYKDAMKSKHFRKGLEELTEEGAIQVFYATQPGHPDPILGAVGELQFDVFQYRMLNEYGVEVTLERLPHQVARWVEGEGYQPRRFWGTDHLAVTDRDGRNVLLFRNEWSMRYVMENNENLVFRATAQAR